MIAFSQAGFALVLLLIVWGIGRASLFTIFIVAVAGASIGSIATIARWVNSGLTGLAPLFNAVGGGPVG